MFNCPSLSQNKIFSKIAHTALSMMRNICFGDPLISLSASCSLDQNVMGLSPI